MSSIQSWPCQRGHAQRWSNKLRPAEVCVHTRALAREKEQAGRDLVNAVAGGRGNTQHVHLLPSRRLRESCATMSYITACIVSRLHGRRGVGQQEITWVQGQRHDLTPKFRQRADLRPGQSSHAKLSGWEHMQGSRRESRRLRPSLSSLHEASLPGLQVSQTAHTRDMVNTTECASKVQIVPHDVCAPGRAEGRATAAEPQVD